jgi:hypothetical protein
LLPWPEAFIEHLDKKAEEIMKNARPSVTFLAWQLSLIGETVRNDLPGYDEEASWKPIVERNERWLEIGED